MPGLHTTLLLALVVTAWAVFSWALVAQHRAYNSNAFDLGFFDQIIWNTSRGRPFETTFVPYNFLGQHVEPVLFVFALIYRVRPDVELLLLAQAAVAAWAALPLFLAARRLLVSATAALLIAAAYLIAPHLHGAVLFDFHPEVLGTAGIFAALALLAQRRPGPALAALATLFLLKEDAALAGAGFAVIVWLRGYRRHAIALAGASLLYLALVTALLMPAVRGGPGDLPERYGYLGTDTRGIATGAFRHPDRVWNHLSAPNQRRGVAYLLVAHALLPLAGPAAVAALPVLAANLLATHPPQGGLTLHYAILPHALLTVAAVVAIARFARPGASPGAGQPAAVATRWRPYLPLLLAALLLVAQTVSFLLGSSLGPRRFAPEHYRQSAHTAAIGRVIRAVPPEVPLSGQGGLLPHLSQRRAIWEFPRLGAAEYVIIDRKGWRSSQSDGAGYERTIAALPSLGYCLLLAEDGVELYARCP